MLLPHVLLSLCNSVSNSATVPTTCNIVHGYSFPTGSLLGHVANITSVSDCCAQCQKTKGCGSWTLHANGCWLHSPPKPTDYKPCGDGSVCISGDNGVNPLPKPPMPSPSPTPPIPSRPLAKPSLAHLRFHEDNVGAISHFGMQTFVDRGQRKCDKTWPVDTFNPTLLDTDQWVATAKSFGAKYYVLVADHFSGFSLYPTKAHNYSVAATKWRNGTADIVADFVRSCLKYGIRPAVYYSVHANWYYKVCSFNVTAKDYPDPASRKAAQEEFEDMAMLQLQELAQRYGSDLAELWFDAGVRQSQQFLDRVNTFVTKQLPETATCHSCHNLPDPHLVSWMGNEETVMPYGATGVWNANDESCSHNGVGSVKSFGTPYGSRWCAAHCDAVLRNHFWFWDKITYGNSSQGGNLNNASKLVAMHMTSVGRGCNMVLDMSPTDTGLLIAADVQTYKEFGDALHTLYDHSSRGVASWTNDPSATSSPFNITLLTPRQAQLTLGAVVLRENMTNGQTISSYLLQYSDSGGTPSASQWMDMTLHNEKQLTIGNRRIHWFEYPSAIAAGQFRVLLRTLPKAGATGSNAGDQEFHVPNLRSVNIYKWDDPELAPLLAYVKAVK